MKATIRYFDSPDIDLKNFHPENPEEFSYLLQAFVGPEDGEGEESVSFVVITPRKLAEEVHFERVVFGRPFVVVSSPDVPRVLAAVRAAIEKIEAESWDGIARRLERLGIYEFEDYVPYKPLG